MINCKLRLCVFNREGQCLLEEIEIGSLGSCENSLLLNICPDSIEDQKESALKKLEETLKIKKER